MRTLATVLWPAKGSNQECFDLLSQNDFVSVYIHPRLYLLLQNCTNRLIILVNICKHWQCFVDALFFVSVADTWSAAWFVNETIFCPTRLFVTRWIDAFITTALLHLFVFIYLFISLSRSQSSMVYWPVFLPSPSLQLCVLRLFVLTMSAVDHVPHSDFFPNDLSMKIIYEAFVTFLRMCSLVCICETLS